MKEGSPIAVREIDHVVLRVRDVDRMRQFYCEVLGCSIEKHQERVGLLQLRAGRSLIDLVDVTGTIGRAGGAPPGTEGRNVDHVCLRVEPFDAEAIMAFLRERGVPHGSVESRYGAEGEGPSLYLTDPEGNTIELKGPPWEAAGAATGG